MTTKPQKRKAIDINGIREIMAEEIDKLQREETTAASVNAIVNAVGKVINTVRLEMEYARMCGVTPRIDFIKLKSMKPKELASTTA